MDQNMDQEQQQEKPAVTITIGDSLRAAREKAGLSVEDVAADLLLKPELIEAIEANKLEGLSAPAYVKGYIRSYARLLGLDSTDLIAEYESLGFDQPGWTIPENQQKKSGSILRLLSLAVPVGLVLTGLFITWLVTSGYLSPPVDDDPETATTTTESATTAIETQSNTRRDNSATPSLELTEPQPLISITNQVVLTEETKTQEAGSLSLAAVSTGVQVSEGNTYTNQEQSQNTATNTVTEGSSAATGSTSVSLAESDFIRASDGSDEVIVILIEDSWIEIDDASKQQLLNGLLKAGDVKILTGQAPFQVFLGNANGVQLTINGVDYDVLARKRKNNTARFALINP